MKHVYIALSILIMTLSQTTYAESDIPDMNQEGKKVKHMTPQERKAFHQERKEKWKAMSAQEKLEVIEKKRSQRIKRMNDTWENMSDDEKIKHVEERMKRKGKHMKKRKEHMSSTHDE